ncbi:CoA transferase [Maritimibacter sp. UBA3975]|uniref:CaiB/BaiF CoA transferase family protein n=1 Tax=Maritimibacter sp. UBA3975 TaxID=1946833 RepID=UPI000C096BA3|nr:CoA transferase [Maritimibacter sp. UBA3975]MAM60257.1 CoA transferase [Maritimibacter sp.]|tara:strand:- start:6323 stop:7471 length:1149 start_codon:yes stop_codon:yes gene_type:complete
MAKPLEGIRVADFSHVIAGPLATQFLNLLGAEVIKVEPPAGDPMRNYTRNPERRGMAEPFVGANAGKKSVVLDLKTDEGRAAARKLVATADVVVENFRPGVAERLGLGPQALTTAHPELIYCSVSGFGQDGPMRDFPAIDQVIQSVSGLMLLSGHEGEPAERIGFPIVDTYSALLSAFAILSAVVQRERDPQRRGQVVDVSMLDATMVMMSSVVVPMMLAGESPRRAGNRGFSGAPTADTFATADGEITIGAVQQIQVERLFRTLGCEDLLDDARFSTPDARMANDAALQAVLKDRFATRTALDWEADLAAAGVPAGKVRPLDETMTLEQLQGRDLFLDLGDGSQILNAGFKFGRDGPGVASPAPGLGADTEAVLAQLKAED